MKGYSLAGGYPFFYGVPDRGGALGATMGVVAVVAAIYMLNTECTLVAR
jgi:hypothetical protein